MKIPELTKTEREYVGSLVGHPGYAGLLKLIDIADAELLERLENAPPEKEDQLLSLWRASRRIRKILTQEPEALAVELGPIVE